MDTFSSLTSDQINYLLDEELAYLSKPWMGSIPFLVHVISEDDSLSPALFDRDLELVDICDCLNAGRYPTRRLYFSKSQYPPPKKGEMTSENSGKTPAVECQGWIDLKRDICTAAHNAGNPILSNGSTGKNRTPCRIFRCPGHRSHESRAQPVSAENNYRGTSMVNNDKGNRRVNGKTAPRKVKTTEKSTKCPHTSVILGTKFKYKKKIQI